MYGPEGAWLIEGNGIDTDITVYNLPFGTFNGKDAQLEAAEEYLKKMIKEKPLLYQKHLHILINRLNISTSSPALFL